MAAGDSTKGKPATANGTMSLNRFDGIRGAAWIITARGREERRQRHLISTDEQNENGPHTGLRARVVAGDTRLNREHVGAQCIETSPICIGSTSNSHVDWRTLAKCREQFGPHELAQPSLQSVAIDGRVVVERNHDPDARSGERGSEDTDVEVNGPNSLPLSNDRL
jgi:hypothetical protein